MLSSLARPYYLSFRELEALKITSNNVSSLLDITAEEEASKQYYVSCADVTIGSKELTNSTLNVFSMQSILLMYNMDVRLILTFPGHTLQSLLCHLFFQQLLRLIQPQLR